MKEDSHANFRGLSRQNLIDRDVVLPNLKARIVSGKETEEVVLSRYSFGRNTISFSSQGACREELRETAVDLEFEFASIHWKFKSQCLDSELELIHDADSSLISDFLNAVRKESHIEICRSDQVEGTTRDHFLTHLKFKATAIPDFNLTEIDTSTVLLGKKFHWPFLITGMTGGVDKGLMVNQRLAEMAQHFQIPMGVGSQRIALENPEFAATFQVKKKYKNLFLIGNLGFAEILNSSDPLSLAKRAVEMIDADALAIHLNVLQELVQSEGEHQKFAGFFDRLEKITRGLGVPVMLKEVGAGLDFQTAEKAVKVGISALDVGGSGGTSWAAIEGLRAQSPVRKRMGELFRDWGSSTAECVNSMTVLGSQCDLIATGGVRSGLDSAKLIALGACSTGVGLPFFRASLESVERLFEEFDFFAQGLRTTMILTNSLKLKDLSSKLCVKS